MMTTGSLSPHINLLLLHTALRLADCHVGLKELFRGVFPIPIPAHVIVDVGRGASERKHALELLPSQLCLFPFSLHGPGTSGKSGSEALTSIRLTLFSAAETPSWSRLRGRYRTVCTRWNAGSEYLTHLFNPPCRLTLCIRPLSCAFACWPVGPSTRARWSAAAHCLAPVKAWSTSATDIARDSCRLRELAAC
ncbi:hypothetical protein C8F01DRAFT_1138229 [Mycena amicta]|nr:hypothetical protein C8F01DRAFT_1138229 [Mycena amicta]